MDLRITGVEGVIFIDDFLSQKSDDTAEFRLRNGRWNQGASEQFSVAARKHGAALMIENMAAAAADPTLRAQWMTATERTQMLLDAVWESGKRAS